MSLTKLKDVTIYWANLYDRNKMSNKFQVDLSCLSDSDVEALEDMGVAVRNKGNEQENFVTAKSAKYEIRPYDTKGTELKDVKIGNGSKADVLVSTYEWKSPAGKKGVSVSIKKLIITDLLEYVPDMAGEAEEEEVL
jgi:hypothetical protein